MTDTERPTLPPPPPIGGVVDIPRESAVEATQIATHLLAVLVGYRDEIRPCLEADPPVIDRGTLEELDRIRRSVATTTDLIVSRDYSAEATTYARVAARYAERVAGLAMLAGERAGVLAGIMDVGDVFGRTASMLRAMAVPSDEVFALALESCRTRSDLTRGAMVAAVAREDLDGAALEQRRMVERMAADGKSSVEIGRVLDVGPLRVRELAQSWDIPIPGDVDTTPDTVDVPAVMWDILARVEDVATDARRVTRTGLDEVAQAQAADWSAALFSSAKYLLHLRAALDARGHAR